MQEPTYVERQNFHPWAYAILLATGVGGLLLSLPAMDGSVVVERAIPGFLMLATAAILVNVLAMTIRVLPNGVHIHFGRIIFYYSKTIPFDEVKRVEVVNYEPLRESGGWGIRWGKHQGQKARYFSARGNRAVLLETGDDLFILGSSDPERLEQAICAAWESAAG